MNLEELRRLAGIGQNNNGLNTSGINISVSGTEKARLMREHNIKPGTPEWFQLWFSRPYMTGEKPVGK